jgi:hypothetical protein
MNFFSSAAAALGKKIANNNNNSYNNAGLGSIVGMGDAASAIGRAISGGSSKPVAADHTHEQPKGDVSRLESNFMGGRQQESFKALTNPKAELDRGGRAISPDSLDPVGIEPAMNPPMATPVDIDEKGINSLYNEF